MDIHSFSEPTRVRVRHVALDLELDFAGKRVQGEAELALERSDRQVVPLSSSTTAFCRSTSTIARRADTIDRGSYVALRINARMERDYSSAMVCQSHRRSRGEGTAAAQPLG